MKPAAIPTKYADVQFRSRLEARWAAMFDELEWRWEYEPEDLHGYIPDFMLLTKPGPVLVEVKPRYSVPALLAAAAGKIDRSGWESSNANNALIVGGTWNADNEEGLWQPVIGALRQLIGSDYPGTWACGVWHHCLACKKISVHHDEQGWACMLCGAYKGDGLLGDVRPRLLKEMWAYAGNVVQWKPRR